MAVTMPKAHYNAADVRNCRAAFAALECAQDTVDGCRGRWERSVGGKRESHTFFYTPHVPEGGLHQTDQAVGTARRNGILIPIPHRPSHGGCWVAVRENPERRTPRDRVPPVKERAQKNDF